MAFVICLELSTLRGNFKLCNLRLQIQVRRKPDDWNDNKDDGNKDNVNKDNNKDVNNMDNNKDKKSCIIGGETRGYNNKDKKSCIIGGEITRGSVVRKLGESRDGLRRQGQEDAVDGGW